MLLPFYTAAIYWWVLMFDKDAVILAWITVTLLSTLDWVQALVDKQIQCQLGSL